MDNYVLKEISSQEFNTFNSKATLSSFLQSEEMAKFMNSRHWETKFLGVQDKEQDIKLVALLACKNMTGGKHFELQYGPVLKSLEENEAVETFFYSQLKEYVKENGGLELLVIPNTDYQTFDNLGQETSSKNQHFIDKLSSLGYQHREFQIGYNDRGEATWHYVKDLSNIFTPSDLMKSYSKEGIYSVKKTKEFGIEVRPLNYEELQQFQEMTAYTAKRLGFSDHELSYYQDIYNIFKDKAEFLVAEMNFENYYNQIVDTKEKIENEIDNLNKEIMENDSAKKKKQRHNLMSQMESLDKRISNVKKYVDQYGSNPQILAGALFMYGPTETVYLSSGSWDEFKSFYAPFAIQHYAMSKTINQHIPFYNFFGIQGVFDGSDGVLRFKKNFSGYIVNKVGYFDYYPRPLKHKLLTFIKKVLKR